MASFAKGEQESDDGLKLLILSAGLPCSELCMVIDQLKAQSKAASSHKRRELYWAGYSELASGLSASEDGPAYCFLKYSVTGGEGQTEKIELTKRQRALVSGGCDIMGSKKLRADLAAVEGGDKKPAAAGGGGPWAMAFDEETAAGAWEDLMLAEPCIYMSADGLFVSTRLKRVQCKSYSSSPFKSIKDVEKALSEMTSSLRGISFTESGPPSVLPYNVVLAGAIPASTAAALSSSALTAGLGLVDTISIHDIYAGFEKVRNRYLLNEAGKLLATMHIDIAKGITPPLIITSSMKDAATARKNSLMKRVFVHESKTKFIEGCKADVAEGGGLELNIISGPADESLEFFQYGGIVFELFFRMDLATMG